MTTPAFTSGTGRRKTAIARVRAVAADEGLSIATPCDVPPLTTTMCPAGTERCRYPARAPRETARLQGRRHAQAI